MKIADRDIVKGVFSSTVFSLKGAQFLMCCIKRTFFSAFHGNQALDCYIHFINN